MTPDEREMLVRIDENVKHLIKESEDHETRLRGLERFKNWALALIGLGGSGAGVTQL